MKRDDLYDLAALAVIAEQRSFTRAAAELGISQSALSHAMKALEERLGVRLLSRTTRSVSTTDAGETLLHHLRPALSEIASGVDAASALRGKPSGLEISFHLILVDVGETLARQGCLPDQVGVVEHQGTRYANREGPTLLLEVPGVKPA